LEARVNKKSITETIAENVDKLASTIGGAINPLQGDKQYERIVPIPPVKTYSELPFRQVDCKSQTGKQRSGVAVSRSRTKKSVTRKSSKITTARKRKAS
jgi:hypothetical protein